MPGAAHPLLLRPLLPPPRLILLAAGRWRYSEPHSAPLRFPFRGRSPARSAAEKAPAATVPQLPRPLPSAGPRFAGLPVRPAPAMATKKGGSRLETEIERCRSECQWERIPELVKQLSAKLIANGAARWVGRDSGVCGGGESRRSRFVNLNADSQGCRCSGGGMRRLLLSALVERR